MNRRRALSLADKPAPHATRKLLDAVSFLLEEEPISIGDLEGAAKLLDAVTKRVERVQRNIKRGGSREV